jgi:hypothetical protein
MLITHNLLVYDRQLRCWSGLTLAHSVMVMLYRWLLLLYKITDYHRLPIDPITVPGLRWGQRHPQGANSGSISRLDRRVETHKQASNNMAATSPPLSLASQCMRYK